VYTVPVFFGSKCDIFSIQCLFANTLAFLGEDAQENTVESTSVKEQHVSSF